MEEHEGLPVIPKAYSTNTGAEYAFTYQQRLSFIQEQWGISEFDLAWSEAGCRQRGIWHELEAERAKGITVPILKSGPKHREDLRIQQLTYQSITTNKVRQCRADLRKAKLEVRKYTTKVRCDHCGSAQSKYTSMGQDGRKACMECLYKIWKANKDSQGGLTWHY